MAWIIGVDEAGYGPNLGPFVMSAAACRLPDEQSPEGPDLWRLLSAAVRRGGDRADGRLLIDDSKVVHAGAHGLAALERGVLAVLGPAAARLHDQLAFLCVEGLAELQAEPWYRGEGPVPGLVSAEELTEVRGRLATACAAAGVADWRAGSVVVCPPRFNALADAAESKGAVLAHALRRLLAWVLQGLPGDDGLAFFIDKHGGRNAYAAQVQNALGGVVLAEREGNRGSVYRVAGLARPVRLTFAPGADGAHLGVALASMVSKYLRERLMGEFNGFWQQRVPGLKPTAGYPGDAARFWRAIRPAAEQLGLAESALWRRR
jgi:ribonuclease HII